jgi:hypothetical protein
VLKEALCTKVWETNKKRTATKNFFIVKLIESVNKTTKMSAFVFVCKEYTKNFVTNLIDISHNDKNEQKLSLGYSGTEGT